MSYAGKWRCLRLLPQLRSKAQGLYLANDKNGPAYAIAALQQNDGGYVRCSPIGDVPEVHTSAGHV